MFIELHAQSAFSFLEGAELPEAFAGAAARLEMPAVALVDRDGVFGAPRFTRAALDGGVKPIVGSEITLADGSRLPLLVEDREGYQNLCRLITRMKLGAPKGAAATTLDDLAPYAAGLVCLTGGARGPLALRLAAGDVEGARGVLARLVAMFGRSNCYVEVQRHLEREQERVLQGLVALARAAHVPLVATSQPLHARPEGRLLADVFTCIREKTDLDHAGRLLAVNGERRLRSDREMTQLFRDLPDALASTGELALRLGFTLKDLGYRFPEFPLPPGEAPVAHLRELVARGVRARYGTGPLAARARSQVAHELDVIGRLDLAGYFLIVWDIVEYCRANDILVQGRGSAANSAVCYALGITAVDPIGMELLFERFLSEARGAWSEMEIGLPSGERREAVIQKVYRRYGRLGAGMTANVITYRGRSAAREVGKALGLPRDMQDRLARLVSNWGYQDSADLLTKHLAEAGCDPRHPRIRHFAALWMRIQDLPRHLGQHSGGMVIAAGRLDDVVPLEPATMPGRVVVQWDKDDCAGLGIIKIDLLGLGMMAVLQDSLTLGVPLFQEQLLRMAIVAAGFTATEAEELRRAFGFKRSERLMADVETKLRAGMARQGIHGAAAEEIVHAITSFALYGFPESHASSFALLAYASAYLKVHHPAAFYAALLNNQPMGFYHPATIVKDAQRHGLRILPVDITRSRWLCTIEQGAGARAVARPHPAGSTGSIALMPDQSCGQPAVRLGLRYVRGLREAAARAIVRAREAQPFASIHDLARRAGLARDELATLAAVGVVAPLGRTRRASLWEAALRDPGELFEPPRGSESPLAEMTEGERLVADYAGTGVTLGRHPMAMRRAELRRRGVLSARELGGAANETRVRVAGSVIVRQRPGTAKGFVFLSLEDETGIANVIVTPQRFARHRLTLVTEPFLLVEGIVQQQDGVVSVRAARVEGLSPLAHNVPSHDFG